MCKRVLLSIFFFSLAAQIVAQMVIDNGVYMRIRPATYVIIGGDLKTDESNLWNNGVIELKGNLENNANPLFYASSTGSIEFNGQTNQEISGDYDPVIDTEIIIDNTNNVSFTGNPSGCDKSIYGYLTFQSGKLILNSYNLSLGANNATGISNNSYIVTNSVGSLRRNINADGVSNVLFQIGNSNYNPVTIRNSVSGTTDVYSVRVVDSKPGLFPVSDHAVNRSWVVSEDIPGGSDYYAKVQWNLLEEDINFDRTSCSVGLTNDDGVNVDWKLQGVATGINPYLKSGDQFSSTGVLFVADYFHVGRALNLDFILGGAFNGSAMNTDINPIIPLSDPYGLNTTVSSVPVDAVDWVRIDLRNPGNMATIDQSYSFFVNSQGQLLDTDGTVGAKIFGADSPHYISVNHRNHFQIISSSTIDFSIEGPSYNFILSQSSAWQSLSVTGNAAMKASDGKFMMWPGDINNDDTIKYYGTNNDRNIILESVGINTPGIIQTGIYSALDVNLDGKIIYNGTNSDRAAILYQTGVATPEAVILEHIP